jgi:membrane associated rhomboid family serine protease
VISISEDPENLFARDWDVPWHAYLVPVGLAAIIIGIGLALPAEVTGSWALSGHSLRRGEMLPLGLHLLAHGGWAHVGMNVAALVLLSGPLISRLGAPPLSWARYLYLFVGSGLAGAVLFLLLNRDSASMLGASGAIFGLLGAWARVHPSTGEAVSIRSPRTWILIKVFVQNHLVLFALLVGVAVLTGRSVLVAWEAHLGGLLFGFFATPLYLPRTST